MRTCRPPAHLRYFLQRITVIVHSDVTDTGLMGKTKNLASLAPSKRDTPYCCALCLRTVKGPSSLRRHLLMAHRAVMLIEWGSVAGYHSATADQIRILFEGVARTTSCTPTPGSASEGKSVLRTPRRNRSLRDTRKLLRSPPNLSTRHRCPIPVFASQSLQPGRTTRRR